MFNQFLNFIHCLENVDVQFITENKMRRESLARGAFFPIAQFHIKEVPSRGKNSKQKRHFGTLNRYEILGVEIVSTPSRKLIIEHGQMIKPPESANRRIFIKYSLQNNNFFFNQKILSRTSLIQPSTIHAMCFNTGPNIFITNNRIICVFNLTLQSFPK